MTLTDLEHAVILMVDDNEEDCDLTQRVFTNLPRTPKLRFASDGKELMDYLHRNGRFADPKSSPWPDLILLDLNMPRMGGIEALKAIKSDPRLCSVPVVVMSTSGSDEDVLASYETGSNAFITKPNTMRAWREVMQKLSEFWFDVAQRPNRDGESR